MQGAESDKPETCLVSPFCHLVQQQGQKDAQALQKLTDRQFQLPGLQEGKSEAQRGFFPHSYPFWEPGSDSSLSMLS